MFGLSKTFSLDPRLHADTIYVRGLGSCQLFLMNDTRWPWCILVPMIADAEELHDLSPPVADSVMLEANTVGKTLKELTGCEKINIAAIGNIVRQLHIHVVARSEGDPNWPKPVWGFEQALPYGTQEANIFVSSLQKALRGKFI